MAKIRIKEVTDSTEGGDQMVFITDDGRKYNLKNEEEKKKLQKSLSKE